MLQDGLSCPTAGAATLLSFYGLQHHPGLSIAGTLEFPSQPTSASMVPLHLAAAPACRNTPVGGKETCSTRCHARRPSESSHVLFSEADNSEEIGR